jgi:hypothetical protein
MSVFVFLFALAFVLLYLVPILMIYIVTFLMRDDYENFGRTDEGYHACSNIDEDQEVPPVP